MWRVIALALLLSGCFGADEEIAKHEDCKKFVAWTSEAGARAQGKVPKTDRLTPIGPEAAGWHRRLGQAYAEEAAAPAMFERADLADIERRYKASLAREGELYNAIADALEAYDGDAHAALVDEQVANGEVRKALESEWSATCNPPAP